MFRKRTLLIGLMAIALAAWAALSVGGTQRVEAHQLSTPSPNGVSPWKSSERWMVTKAYGTVGHCDYVVSSSNWACVSSGAAGNHYNAWYAVDFASGCNQPVRPIWDGITVSSINATQGVVLMRKTVGGIPYEVEYRHLNTIYVKTGQVLQTTSTVGVTGNRPTSTTSGCHLHLVVRRYHNGAWHSVPPQFCGTTYGSRVGTWVAGCTNTITVYDNVNYGGPSWTTGTTNDPDLRNNVLGAGPCPSSCWSDRIHAVIVRPGCRVTLYQHENYTGGALTLAASDPDLRNNYLPSGASWADQATSIKVSCT